MRVLFRLFLRRFKKWRFVISLASFAILPGIFKFITWLFIGLTDEAVFSWLLQQITSKFGGGMLIDYLVNHPYIILFSVPVLGIVVILLWMYVDARREYRSGNLTNALSEMHSIMINIARKQSGTKVRIKDVEEVAPILLDRLEVMELEKWPKYLASVKRRIKRAVPKTRQPNRYWYFKVVAKAVEIQKELVGSRRWRTKEGLIVCKWLDEWHWGIGDYRNKDRNWQSLYDSIRPYLLDSTLNKWIQKHIDYSYIACNQMLINYYSAKWSKTKFSKILCSALITSIDQMEIESGLNKILIDISKRLKGTEKEAGQLKTLKWGVRGINENAN